ncbi:bifunctional riboflavin kinase/FAD synthetase [Aquifex aeolicus]|uniref:Riboflavin biosynthesis protein n=1 Tax=Aquifex aeolicus (strain VF5) TaxID=224324 RepID=O66535_AQUAE|nr:bifunctional riboflavin kinase/FAD synthetase [Aquifex aeolicus]AAC06488.1 riboflavin kinase [Aquifex aeolicus VF5]
MEVFLLKLDSKNCPNKRLKTLEEVPENTAITVGNFDGVHLGHRYLIENLKKKAKSENLKTLVLTFCPHPLKVLAPQLLPCELTDINEKIEIFRELGVDYLCFIRFDKEFAKIRAREFLEKIIYEKLKCRYLLVGYDWRYGYRREGEIELAKEVGSELGFEVEEAKPFKIKGHIVSSTLIRRLLREGRVEEVREYLGHNYWVKRKVVKGDQRGSKIGFPTANLQNTENLCLKEGVYAVKVEDKYLGVANYGYRPTFGKKKRVLEVHILDFEGNLRGKRIKVEFLKFIREEKKFSSVEELIQQIKKDVEAVKGLSK